MGGIVKDNILLCLLVCGFLQSFFKAYRVGELLIGFQDVAYSAQWYLSVCLRHTVNNNEDYFFFISLSMSLYKQMAEISIFIEVKKKKISVDTGLHGC